MIKVNLHLVQAIAQQKKHNFFRYYIAMILMDESRAGRVDMQTYIDTVSEKFRVTPKTVINTLQQLHDANWITVAPKQSNFIYYKSLNKISDMLQPSEQSFVAVWIDWNNLYAIKDIRAFCHATFLANKRGEKIISREVLADISNTCRQSQIKYEKHLGVKKTPNFATLGRYENKSDFYDHAYRENTLTGAGRSLFLARSPKDKLVYIMRQIPNTFDTTQVIRLGKRRFLNPAINCRNGESRFRRYCDDVKQIKADIDMRQYVRDDKYPHVWGMNEPIK